MVKIYTFKNAIVTITKPTEKHKKNIEKATEEFVRRLIKGGYLDGNSNSSGTICKK